MLPKMNVDNAKIVVLISIMKTDKLFFEFVYKERKNVSISNVAGVRTYTLENEKDVNRFLDELKDKLMEPLDEDTVIILS